MVVVGVMVEEKGNYEIENCLGFRKSQLPFLKNGSKTALIYLLKFSSSDDCMLTNKYDESIFQCGFFAIIINLPRHFCNYFYIGQNGDCGGKWYVPKHHMSYHVFLRNDGDSNGRIEHLFMIIEELFFYILVLLQQFTE